MGRNSPINQRKRSFAIFFYNAYMGFASGRLAADAYSVHLFVAYDGECFIAHSYAKNMGLYGECVGALSIVCRSATMATRVER